MNLTDKVQELIESEISAMGKRAKDKLTAAELASLEKEIDVQLDSLRKWSKTSLFMWEDSTGPFFATFFRERKTGADMKQAPFMTVSPGISGVKFGIGRDGDRRKFKGSFDWTSQGGSFVKEWSEEDQLDEEFRVQVTGRLRIEIELEKTVGGKVIRVAEAVDKNIFQNYPIVLRGSEAVRQTVVNSSTKAKK